MNFESILILARQSVSVECIENTQNMLYTATHLPKI